MVAGNRPPTGGRRRRTGRSTLVAGVTLMVLAVVVAQLGPSSKAIAEPTGLAATTSFTMYPGSGSPSQLAQAVASVGQSATLASDYLAETTWADIDNDHWALTQWQGSGYRMVWGVPMLPSATPASLAVGATGAYDHYFTTLATNLVAVGEGNSILRLGWEFNQPTFAWYAAGQPAAFVSYWQQIVTTMRAVPGADFQFEWNPSRGDNGPKDRAMGDLTAYYPGNQYVDIVGMDVYDQAFGSYPGSAAEFQTVLTQQWGLQWLASFGAAHGKPIAIPELGLGEGPSAPDSGPINGTGRLSGGDDPLFIANMFDWIIQNDLAGNEVANVSFWDVRSSSIDQGQNPLTAGALRQWLDRLSSPTGAPIVTGLSAASGLDYGGTSVTITGAGFTGATAVTFGGTAVPFTVNSDTSITTESPPGSGTVPLTVTTPGGNTPATNFDLFTFVVPTPVIDSISPAIGTIAGGSTVTIDGSGLSGATGVTFGSTAASFHVLSDTQMTATSPPNASGNHNISVISAGGTSANSSADVFNYVPGPAIAGITPSLGPPAGGTSVLIFGTGFASATSVSFGAVPATSFQVLSGGQISAVSPPESPGTRDISVTTAAGSSAPVTGAAFSFVPRPAVAGVSPAQGSPSGGTRVTISGSGFAGASQVAFGAIAASFQVVSDGQITAVSPPGSAGSRTISVTTVGGRSEPVATDQFSYVAGPVAAGITPSLGTPSGGTSVLIYGSGLSSATSVSFGGVPAPSFQVLSAGQIVAVSPPGTAGTRNISVTTAAGTSPPVAGDAFSYVPQPVVTGVSIGLGTSTGGTRVTVFGSGFSGATSVSFGTTAAPRFQVVSDGEITTTSPPGGPGGRHISVTTAGGTSPRVDADLFTYVPHPAISGVTPSLGPPAGGTSVMINGFGFIHATSVSFGNTPAVTFQVLSAGQIRAVAPPGSPGLSYIYVTTSGGTTTTGQGRGFSFVPRPVVTGITASTGTRRGGTRVTIFGSGFTGATAVSFGATRATRFHLDSAGQITAVAPPGSPGHRNISVTTAGGTSARVAGDRFTYR
jgi:hypothetical protein